MYICIYMCIYEYIYIYMCVYGKGGTGLLDVIL